MAQSFHALRSNEPLMNERVARDLMDPVRASLTVGHPDEELPLLLALSQNLLNGVVRGQRSQEVLLRRHMGDADHPAAPLEESRGAPLRERIPNEVLKLRHVGASLQARWYRRFR